MHLHFPSQSMSTSMTACVSFSYGSVTHSKSCFVLYVFFYVCVLFFAHLFVLNKDENDDESHTCLSLSLLAFSQTMSLAC